MEEDYEALLDSLGILDYMKRDISSPRSISYEELVKSIFYSEAPSGDIHNIDLYELLIGKNLMSKEGRLQDYLILSNITDNSLFLEQAFERGVEAEDIVRYRELMLDGLLGKYTEGTRRFKVKVGPYITVPIREVSTTLSEIAHMLNNNPESQAAAFLNAVDFFNKLIRLHPFEDENGRTSRAITNAYLVRNGLNPFFVEKDYSIAYTESPDLFYFAEYSANVIPVFAFLSLDRQKKDAVTEHLMNLVPRDSRQRIFIDEVLLLAGKIDAAKIKSDIERVYREGVDSDIGLAVASVWLALVARTNSPIIEEALVHNDPRLRATAVYTLGRLFALFRSDDLDGVYAQRLKRIALEDGSFMVRMIAISVLEKYGKLDGAFSEQVIEHERRSGVVSSLGKSITALAESREFVRSGELLLQNDNRELRLRGYQVLIVHGQEELIVKLMREKLQKEDKDIARLIIIELNATGKINNKEISAAVSEIARNDPYIRMLLLGELSRTEDVGLSYSSLFENIIESNESTQAERAYALYLLGKERGFDYLKGRYSVRLGCEPSTIGNIALFLTFVSDLESGKVDRSEIPNVLNSHDLKLNIIELSEIGRLLGTDVVDKDTSRLLIERVEGLECKNAEQLYRFRDTILTKFCGLRDDPIMARDLKVAARDNGEVAPSKKIKSRQ